jgi:hypothetical protein
MVMGPTGLTPKKPPQKPLSKKEAAVKAENSENTILALSASPDRLKYASASDSRLLSC